MLPRFQDFHRLQVRGLDEYPLHQHSSYEVILVEKRPYTCRLNDTELIFQAHEMLVIKPGDWHQDHFRKGQEHYVLHFSLGGGAIHPTADVVLFVDEIKPSAQIAPCTTIDESQLFQVLEKEALRADEYSACIQDAMLEAFFWAHGAVLSQGVAIERIPPALCRTGFIDRLYRVFENSCPNSPLSIKWPR